MSKQIHICVPLYNRGEDISHLLNNLQDIHNKLDKNIVSFQVHIGDFNSTDIDLHQLIKNFNFKVNIYSIEGNFNISIALQKCFDNITQLDDLVFTLDADTVLETEETFYFIVKNVEKNKTFYCPIVSTEDNIKNFNSTFNGKIYVPNTDHGGSGAIAIYNEDLKRTNEYKNSEFLGPRGELWGWHDTYLTNKISDSGLKWIRRIETNIWLRNNNGKKDKTSKWYRTF